MDVSFLYTPALRIDHLLKKKDAIFPSRVIIDLEDSVHIRAKEQARRHVAQFDFTELASAGFRFGMRVNQISSYDGLADLALIKELRGAGKAHIEYVLVPKVLHPNEVGIYRSLLSSLPKPPKIFSFIETADAVDNADAIAAVSDGLCFGQADLAAEMYSPNTAFIDYARARLCLAASRHRIPAIDTNSFEVKNMDIVHKESTIAKGYGFTGKAAIHPDQVAAINDVFAVSSQVVEKFKSSIAAYESAETGFAIRDGEVIAPPFITKARRMLAFYESQSES